jgi:competence CoiA-like predicted nuclease
MQFSTKPKWVIINEELKDVSEFVHLPPRNRPEAICPECHRPVTMKLGNIRAHHYAHNPNDTCAVTNSETALHLNTKFYIYKQLQNATQLLMEQRCQQNYPRCHNSNHLPWLSDWDEVHLEYSIGPYRADIALLRNSEVVAAIEIAVTHYTEDEKIKYFKNHNIYWIEVTANESIYEDPNPWTSSFPIPFAWYIPGPDHWICIDCQQEEIERKRRQEAQRKRYEYEQKNHEFIHAAKLVDFYFPSGKKFRETYYVKIKVENGFWVKAWVEKSRGKVIATEYATQNQPINEQSLSRLSQVIKLDITSCGKRTIADQFMKWRKWVQGRKFVARDIGQFPFRYVWNQKDRHWVKVIDSAD